MTGPVHLVMPAGVRDPSRPSGGNAYDVRVCAGLAARGWSVREHEVPGDWPAPDQAARDRVSQVLSRLAAGDAVLVDGLVASAVPDALESQAGRLRLGALVHMPLAHAHPGAREVAAREERALVAAAVVVTTSAWTRTWLLGAYPLDPDRLRVARPGTDPAPVATGTPSGSRLLAVGPLSTGKGHDVLGAALPALSDLDWRLDCVGSTTVDAATAAAVLRWAESTGDRVRVLGPRVGADLEATYACTDLLVHPSRSETYGMVLTEAVARGIPVVASDVGGTREALGMTGVGAPGLLVAPGDADSLAGALRTWLTDARLRTELRAAALTRRGSLPSWDETVGAVDAALRSTLLVGAGP